MNVSLPIMIIITFLALFGDMRVPRQLVEPVDRHKFLTTNTMSEAGIIKDLVKCINFCAIKHKSQRRLDMEKTPYINHPIGVAQILTEEGGITDPNVIMAAFLHDTVEDTDTTFQEIESTFGPKINSIVVEVTDDKSLPKQVRKQLQIEHAKSSSYEAKLVKLADKLYNLRDLNRTIPEGWTETRVQEYFEWASKVVDNLRGTNKEIEDKLDILFSQRLKKHSFK